MSLPSVVAPYWKSTPEGELLIGGLTVSSLAGRYGTPFFCYDRGIVEQKYIALRGALPKKLNISYSVKANPNPAFLRFLLERGCGLEIASAGEYCQARSAGCRPGNILFAGPGKTEAELELVIAEGVGEIHAESELEIRRVRAISRRLGVRTRVAIRVNPNEDGQGGAMRMGGKSAPFGIDEEDLDPILDLVCASSELEFAGIHLFVGTQILDHKLLLMQYKKGIEIARHAVLRAGIAPHTVDFGGGLGIPYFPGDTELNLPALGEGLHRLIAEIEGEKWCQHTNFMIEPGRFLVGEAGVYVARINDIKTSRGKKYLILDGGMNHHLAASGNLGQIIKRNFPLAILTQLGSRPAETVDVVGPLCTPLDTLGRCLELPRAQVGDLVGIFQSGAYSRSASPLGFLSHPSPPEVWVENGQDFLIRRRGSWEDYLRDMLPFGALVTLVS